MSTKPEEDLHADWSANELAVLRSADLDAPPAGAVERTLAALGVSAALGAGVGAASSVGGAAQLGRVAHGSMWLKWLAAALVGSGIAGAAFMHHRHEKSVPAAPSANMLPVPVAQLEAPTAVNAQQNAAPPAALMPMTAPSPSAPLPARAEAPEKPDAKDDIGAEIRMIDEAREKLRHGDAPGALATLARYDQLVKRGGSMRAEATVVRIEAYQATGDSARARALGERFMAKNPNSPYAEYVQRMLAKGN